MPVSAFANCGRAVAHVRGSYVPLAEVESLSGLSNFARFNSDPPPGIDPKGVCAGRSCLWLERADVSRERDHVILRELLDSLFHQGACASRAAAVLEFIELPHDVGW